MEELRVAVCVDDKVYLEQIEEELRECLKGLWGSINLKVSLFTDGDRLYEAGLAQPFDLVFLDIEMPGKDGFWLAEQLCLGCPQTRLIFVSSHESWVFDAHEYMPLWFVRKGLLRRDMNRALQKYFQVTARRKISYKIQGGFGTGEVLLRDIMYIECNGHTLTYKMSGGLEYSVYGSLKQVEEELKEYGFLRVHRNYLVNQAYISQIGKQDAVLKNGAAVPMGRDRRKRIGEMMMEYGRKRGSRLCD
ncbi:LytR/AlgR family response regulator transcription factor [Enterocloster citroniae]|uniref:LytR/AlgR family response regulator transcription factor n=1 Tax=Enterocloster citroniae TaxID=358743 RepID=UPI00349EDE57